MKLIGNFNNIPVYSSPDCPKDTIYLLNENAFERVLPKRKDGRLDMRFSINKLEAAFNKIL